MNDESRYSSHGLRLALIVGLSGLALIFAIATADGVRLLRAMRDENRLLRAAASQRTNHLASIRSTIWLTHTYLGEYLLVSNHQDTKAYLEKLQQSWARLSNDLDNYQATTLEEAVLVKRLKESLAQHWQRISRAMASSPHDSSLYTQEIIPLRTSVVEITTQLEGIDVRQAASTEAQIESEFERLGSRLTVALALGLGAAILLGLGCIVYILRIEKQNALRYQEVLDARKSLEQLSARLVAAQENERRTISRELHDQVGQTLNALLVDAANLAKRIPADDALSRRYLDNIKSFADSSVNSIRDIALLLRPSMLDDLGLLPALQWQAREVSRRSGIHVKVSAEGVADSLPDEMRTCIYRIVQEALSNIERHSGAKAATVTVRQHNGELSLSVEDDGHGFDSKRTRGLGRLGMEERVRQLGGRFEIQSETGKGTTLLVTLPVAVLTG